MNAFIHVVEVLNVQDYTVVLLVVGSTVHTAVGSYKAFQYEHRAVARTPDENARGQKCQNSVWRVPVPSYW